MKQHFYSHLIDSKSLIVKLEGMELSLEEKNHLLALADESLHFAVLDSVLTLLSEEDKKAFLAHVHNGDHSQTWHFLKSKNANIESLIITKTREVIAGLHKDIRQARQK